MIRLKQYHSRVRGLPDLLPYAALAGNGIVLCKDGSFVAGFEVRGIDPASATADELEFASAQVNQAFKILGTGWMLHVDAVRSRYDAYPAPEDSHFPDPLSQLFDDERRHFFSGDVCYRTRLIIILSFKPNLGAEKLQTIVKSGGGHSESLDRAFNNFLSRLLEFEDALSAVLRMERLLDYSFLDEFGKEVVFSPLLSHFQLCVTGIEQPVRVPKTPMYLDALIGSEDLIGGLEPRIGDLNICVISIDGLPQESWPTMLSILDGLPLQYRFSNRFICLDQIDAQKEIDSYRKGWKQAIFSFVDKMFNNQAQGRANRDAIRMVEDAEEALLEVQSGHVGGGYLSSCIVLLHEDKTVLFEWARELRRNLLTLGFGARIENVNAVDAWLGTHPANWFANIRRPFINTLNLADLLPLSTVWSGDRYCPCPFFPPKSPPLSVLMTDGSPFWFNLHVRDVGHTMIFGPTGAGKSTLLAFIASQFRRYQKGRVYAFDKGMSLYATCKGMGGTHYNIGETKTLSFAPLQFIDDKAEQSWAEEWIEKLLVLQGVTVTPKTRNDIHAAMDLLKENSRNSRSITDFCNIVQNDSIREGLQHYTLNGSMGNLLDAENDNLGIDDFMVFETDTLLYMGEKNYIPVLLLIFHRISKALSGQPTLIILDECWAMYNNPVMRPEIWTWLKEMRKKNCSVVMATQSLTDAKTSGIFDVIVESCFTKIFLANIGARQETQSELYIQMGCNERQIDIIASAKPKRDYYILTPNTGRLVQLNLQPQSLAFLGASDKHSIERIMELENQHKDSWREIWIKEKCSVDINLAA